MTNRSNRLDNMIHAILYICLSKNEIDILDNSLISGKIHTWKSRRRAESKHGVLYLLKYIEFRDVYGPTHSVLRPI